jgi:hypothetical protein
VGPLANTIPSVLLNGRSIRSGVVIFVIAIMIRYIKD